MSIRLLYRASLSALFRMVFETSPKVMLLPSTLCTRAIPSMIHAELSAIDSTGDWSFLSFFCQGTLCGLPKCTNRSCQSQWYWSQVVAQHIPHIQLSCLSNQDHLGKQISVCLQYHLLVSCFVRFLDHQGLLSLTVQVKSVSEIL